MKTRVTLLPWWNSPSIILFALVAFLISFATTEAKFHPPADHNNNKDSHQHHHRYYLYADPNENNEPVIEFLKDSKHHGRGDFRRSRKPKLVEFYSPHCVRYSFISASFYCYYVCVIMILHYNICSCRWHTNKRRDFCIV